MMGGLLLSDPIKFSDLLKSKNVLAGDTIKLRAGTYTGDFVLDTNINGVEAAPVLFMPYNNEQVIFNGSLTVHGNYIRLQDFEFTDSRTDRLNIRTNGVYSNGLGFQLCGCIIHDVHLNGVSWYGYGVGQVSENIIYNNGFLTETGGFGGHGIYTHNDIGGAHLIARNLISKQLGNYTLHIFSGGQNYLRNYTVEDNIFSWAVQAGGGYGLIDFIYQNNVQYQQWCQIGRYLYDLSYKNINGLIDSNLFMEVATYTVNMGEAVDGVPQPLPNDWENLTESNNTVWQLGAYQWPRETGYTTEPTPAFWSKFVTFTESGRWKGYIALFDRDQIGSVQVDFTGLLEPGVYTLMNYQDMTQVAELDLSVSLVADIMMTGWTSADPIGCTNLGTSWPRFGALVIA